MKKKHKKHFPERDRELDRISRRFARIASKLRSTELHRLHSDPGGITSADLTPDGLSAGSSYFLGYYGDEGILRAFDAYGILDKLREKGWRGFRIEFDLEDPYNQEFRLFAKAEDGAEFVIVELLMHEGHVSFKTLGSEKKAASGDEPGSGHDRIFDVLFIEWLLLQSPVRKFTPARPRLPGQRYPGLGIGREILELMYRMGLRLRKDGIINFPYYYHNAVLYRVRFRFVRPEDEGKVRAYFRDLSDLSLCEASWAFELGCVFETATGDRVDWVAAEQIMPCCAKMEDYLSSKIYRRSARETYHGTSVTVDMEKLAAERAREERSFGEDSFEPPVPHPRTDPGKS